MSDADRRARDQDRAAAIEIVEAAWAEGQIIDADRDKRVEELRRARSLDEIDLFTRDLKQAGSAQEAGPASPAPPVSTAPPVRYGPPMPARRGGTGSARRSKARLLVPLVSLLVFAAAAAGGVTTLVDSIGDSVAGGAGDSPTYAPGVEAGPGGVNVLSRSGYDELVAAVRAHRGGTAAFSAVLYPTYAALELPVDATTQRLHRFHWDGRTLADLNSKSSSSDKRFALGKVDGAVVVRLIKKVRRLATAPTSWYAIVRAPSEDGTMIWAYASNDYDETVYLAARRDGTIVHDSTRP